MELKLSTGDLIAVLMGLAQIAVAVGIGVWTVRRTAAPRPAGQDGGAKRSMRRHLIAWLRSSWLFLVFLLYGGYELWSLLSSDENLSKGFVFKLVFFSFYTAFNIIAAVGFFLFELQMTINSGVLEVLGRSNEIQRSTLEVQRESLSLTPQALERRRPKRKPRR